MSLTEGGACATPCVATDIAGHRGAAVPDRTGVLVPEGATTDETAERIGDAVAELLGDDARRAALARAAVEHAAGLSWSAVAARHLALLCDAVA
jgi:glycosyltransferase involved in cell wall biosynthesis